MRVKENEMIGIMAAAALASPQAQPSASTSATAPVSDPAVAQQIAQASSIGSLLYAFDRAAWVSSDKLTASIPKDQLPDSGGYIVEIAGGGILHVTYYRGTAATSRAFFVADVRDGKVIRHEVLAQPVALTGQQVGLARAREVAAMRARERSYKPCTPAPFNTVVVPSRDNGPIAVYLLSAQQDPTTWPVGGNYRVIVAPDGKLLASRPYSVGCLNLTLPRLPAGAKPVGFMVSHLLDLVPTEIHVFASFSLHTPVFVITPDKRAWKVEGATITPTDLPKNVR